MKTCWFPLIRPAITVGPKILGNFYVGIGRTPLRGPHGARAISLTRFCTLFMAALLRSNSSAASLLSTHTTSVEPEDSGSTNGCSILRSYPHYSWVWYGGMFHPTVYEGILSFWGSLGVSSQGMWAKSLIHGMGMLTYIFLL